MPAARLRSALLNHPLAPADDPRPDGELLALFLARGDEAAFAALVVRHTPAVRAACRTWLRSQAGIDDAAQATFLVLVRRADSIRDPKALPRWLYRVAGNVARRLRAQLKAGPLPADVPGREPPAADPLADLVAEEVARLPEKYRLPMLLCYAAGLTVAAVAERLGCPRETVLTRLARGRDLVLRRMAARGAAPAAVLATLPAARAVAPGWVAVTARAAKGIRAGASPTLFGVSDRTAALTEGAVRAMLWKKLRAIAAAAMLATGLTGFVIGQWASADPPRKPAADTPQAYAADPADRVAALIKDAAKGDDAKPAPGRRREAVIRVPAGTFVKEVDVPPYGSARVSWTYEDDRVTGLVQASVMGGEVEVATDAEFSLSSNGTIYGVLNGVKVNHLRLPGGEEFGKLQPYAGLWPVVEPLVNEVTTDLPFSYQFRVSGDRLTILNFRMLLAGPNPLGKLYMLAAAEGGSGDKQAVMVLGAFQALGTAIEGTYTAADGQEKAPPKPRPTFKKPTGRTVTPKGETP